MAPGAVKARQVKVGLRDSSDCHAIQLVNQYFSLEWEGVYTNVSLKLPDLTKTKTRVLLLTFDLQCIGLYHVDIISLNHDE